MTFSQEYLEVLRQDRINALTHEYNAARDRGDKAAAEKLHRQIRNVIGHARWTYAG